MGESDDGRSGGLLRPRASGARPGATESSPGGLLTPRPAGAAMPAQGASTGAAIVKRPARTLVAAVPPAPGAGSIRLEKGATPMAEPPPPLDEAAIQRTLRSLKRDVATFLELLFPDRGAAELLREIPPQRAFHDRVRLVETELAEADRDGGDRFPQKEVKAARLRFEAMRSSITRTGGDAFDAAVAQLRHQQRVSLLGEIFRHANPERVLYGSDVLKVERAAQPLGFSPADAHEIARAEGFTLLTTEARQWVPCRMLPGSPSTLAAVARALLQHEAEGTHALRHGAVSQWLVSNSDAELAGRVREHELLARQPEREALARHRAAWDLGAREICWAQRSSTSPDDFGRLWDRREIDDRTVALLAQSQVLGAWFGSMDERVLEARANALGRSPNDRRAIEQLRWSLGVPWSVGGESFRDVATLADRARASQPIAQAALRAASDGTLIAWLESLPAGRGDSTWQAILSDPQFNRLGSACGFWVGVFRNAQDRSLTLVTDGAAEILGSWRPLLQSTLAARHWDALKSLRASGELAAFILTDSSHPVGLSALPQVAPGDSEDSTLNTLLWSLGASGMVIEWGSRDRAVQTPEDLAALYEEDAERFEEELGKGYIFTWLMGQVGWDPLWGPAVQTVQALMLGRAPMGHASAALVQCARRGGPLPVNPRSPGNGVVTALVSPEDPNGQDWSLLLPQLRSGLALFWLLGQSRLEARALAQSSLSTWVHQRVLLPPEKLIAALAPIGRPATPQLDARSVPPPSSFPPQNGHGAAPPLRTVPPPGPVPEPSRSLVFFGVLSFALLAGLGAYLLKSKGGQVDSRVDGGGGEGGPDTQERERISARSRMRCAVSGTVTRFGQSGSVVHGATLSVHGESVGVGWVVPGKRRGRNAGADDAAAALLSLDGQLQQTLDPEVPDDMEYPEFSPRSIGRVTVRWSDEGVPSVLSDEVTATYADETIRCAGLSARWAVRRESVQPGDPGQGNGIDGQDLALGARPAWTPELLQPYWCRTVNPSAPFVIAQQLFTESNGAPERRTNFLASGPDLWSPAAVTDFAMSRSQIRRVPTAANPRRILKDRVADEWRASTVEGAGHVVVWRERDNIRGVWLDSAYRLVGGAWQVQTNDDYAAPEVRMRGREGLLVFATRQQRVDGSPFRLAAVSLSFGAMPDAFRWLPVGLDDARTDHVSPSLALLQGRSWLLTFTMRPRREIATLPVEAQSDAVFMQSFDLGLQPLTAASSVVPRARDAELVAAGQRFLIASFASPGGSRSALSATVGRCEGP
jgi:hypothetical protein